MKNKEKKSTTLKYVNIKDVEDKIVIVRGLHVLLDRDVATLYQVETKRVNEAVRNNPERFPDDYMFELSVEESSVLRSKISTLEQREGKGRYSKYNYKAFTEKGLYMLATVLKSQKAIEATFAIIETFAKVRGLKRELLELHQEMDKEKQKSKMQHFGEMLTDIVMPDLQTTETESSLELNFLIGKIKHSVKRIRKDDSKNK
ncbi:MAG: ORF6N domain-containing protein [Bacteroidales bacterium]|nr:ORF6N domain-containing protein [Bacteroidales bacterium]